MKRSPLKKGNRYRYRGYPSGFVVKYVAFRGHPEDDGALEGVAIRWTGLGGSHRRGATFVPCRSDEEFFSMLVFKNAYDAPAKVAP